MAVIAASSTTASPSATSGHTSSSVSAGAIAGIVIGTLLGGSLLIALLLNLLKRYHRHKFTRVPNPAHDPTSATQGTPQIMSTTSMGSKYLSRHGKSLSTSTEPLISPTSWPRLPSPSRLQSPSIPPPSLSSRVGDNHFSLSFGLHPSGSAASLTPSIPPLRTYFQTSSESVRLASDGTPPSARQASGDSNGSSTSPKPQQTLFLHRMLQSRARASEVAFPSPPQSPDISLSRSSTMNTTVIRADVERLIADAERDAVRDAERAEKEEDGVVPKQTEKEEEWDEVDTESNYSQNSAPLDHAALLSDTVSRRNSSSIVPRRKSTRRRARTPAPGSEVPFPLTPVTEMPDTPRTREGNGTLPALTAAKSWPGEHVSDVTASGPMSSVVDASGALPLLTSTNFGKGSTSSGTPPGSISSAAGWGSNSNGTASRYPSLAASSILGSSQSGQRSDGGTDWHNPPSGLAGLKLLSIGPLQNPHSPVKEQPEPREESSTPSHPSKAAPTQQRARLREGTSSSIPEVERRTVMQGGIARIDVVL